MHVLAQILCVHFLLDVATLFDYDLCRFLGVDDAYLMMHSWMRVSVEEPTMTKRER